MSIEDRLTLKSYFITGASPDESDFGNLIDSTLLVEDIVTSLTSTSTTDPLAASLGKTLNDSIVALTSRVVSLEGEEADFASNYYNKTEVDTKFNTTDGLLDGLVLANYQSQIDALQGQIDNIDTTGSPAGIEISNVSGLQSELDVKASITELNSVRDSLIASISAIDTSGGSVDLSGINSSIATLNDEIDALETQLAGKASSSHTHSNIYTKTEVDTLITGIDTSDHTHVAADITDLGSEIQAKTNLLVADHSDLTNNPHSVTKSQVGLGKVENLTPSEIVALAGGVTQLEIDGVQADLASHKGQSNPHGITKLDLGLGDVPNLNPQVLLEQHLNEVNPHGIDLTFFDVYAKAEADTRTQFYIDSLRYAFTPLGNSDSAGAIGDFAYDASNLYFKTGPTSWAKIPFVPVYITREATQDDVDAGIATEVGEVIEVNEVELPQVTNINVTENFNITNQAGDSVINLTEEGDVRLTSTIVESVTIEGDTIVNENISSSTDTVTIQDNAVIEGDTTIEENLFVKKDGNTVFKVTNEGDTTIAGDTTINKSLSVTKDEDTIFEVTEEGKVNITGDTTVGNFTSTGDTTINKNLYSSTGTFNVQGDTIVNGSLEATEIKVADVFEVRTNIDGSKYLYAPSLVSENIFTDEASLKEIDTNEIDFWERHAFAGAGDTVIASTPQSVKLKASFGVFDLNNLNDPNNGFARLTLQQNSTTKSLAFIEDLSAYALKTDLDGLGGTGAGGGDGSSGETGTDLVLDGTTGGAQSGYAFEQGAGFYAIDYGPDETEGTADDVQAEYWSTQVSATSSTGLVINLGNGANNPYLRYDTQESKWGFSNGGGVSYELKDSYSKTESDSRYEPFDSSYTKSESNARYALTGTGYTKTETNNLLNSYALKTRVAMTSGVAGATDIVIEGRYNNAAVPTGISVDDGTNDMPYIRFDPSAGDWVAYNGSDVVTIGAVVNNITNEGDTIVNEGDTIIQSGLTLDGTTGGADSGYAYQEYGETAQLYADDPSVAGDQEYWELESSSTVSRGLTVDIGLADNPSIIYDVFQDKWIANNGTGNGASFPIKDVDAAISALVDSAPSTLNTLDELASALGDDANFSTTITTALGKRVRFDASQSLSSTEKSRARSNIGAQVSGSYASSSHNHSGVYAPVSHNHSASNITSGTLSISRIPTGTSSTTVCKGNDSRLSNARTPTSHNHDSRYDRYLPNVVFNKTFSGTYDTSDFISELTTDHGCFNNNCVSMKVSWSYAGNRDLNTGDGTIELAGCVIETWGQGSYKHVRITRPNTGTGGPSVWEYNDQGSSYAPGWRRFWTDRDFEISDYYTKAQIDAKLYSA